jgi:hypothetical protein
VLGSSVLGSILAARVSTALGPALSAERVPAGVAASVRSMGQVVDQGGVPAVGGPLWTQSVTSASHAAFLSGLRLALLVGVAATVLGTLCGPWIKPATRELDSVASLHF